MKAGSAVNSVLRATAELDVGVGADVENIEDAANEVAAELLEDEAPLPVPLPLWLFCVVVDCAASGWVAASAAQAVVFAPPVPTK